MIVQRYSINKHQFLFFQKNKVGLKPFKSYSAHLVTSLHTVCISGKDGQEVVGGVAHRVTLNEPFLNRVVFVAH